MKERIKVVVKNDGSKECYPQVKEWWGWRTLKVYDGCHDGYPAVYSTIKGAQKALDSFVVKHVYYII